MDEFTPTDSIFTLEQKFAENPQIYALDTVYRDLGFQIVEDPAAVESVRDKLLREFSLYHTSSENRILPDIKVLRKGDKFYYEYSYRSGSMRIIVNEEQTFDTKLGGLPYRKIEHVLLADQQRNVLDLMSLIRTNVTNNYLSLDSASKAYFEPSYDPALVKIFLSVPLTNLDKGQHLWRIEDFKYKFLHENAHALLSNVDRSNYGEGRLVNAVALQATRRVTKKYPDSNFLNRKNHQSWIKAQLKRYEIEPES